MYYLFKADMMFSHLFCHLIGVSSSVTNPIFYAMLNYNFQEELQIVTTKIRRLFLVCSPHSEDAVHGDHDVQPLQHRVVWAAGDRDGGDVRIVRCGQERSIATQEE